MRDVPHSYRPALQAAKDCTEEGLCYGISLSRSRASPQDFLSLFSALSQVVLETRLLSFAFWQSHVILSLLIHFQLYIHIQKTSNRWCFFFFLKSIYLFTSAKVRPTTGSHLKVTNVLHAATSKLLAKVCFFQGLAPVNKELLDKAWNGKCPFLPWAEKLLKLEKGRM